MWLHCGSSSDIGTTDTTEDNMTATQITRLHLVRKDVNATGGRITTRKLPGGNIRITEYAGREKASVVMDTDGFYL